METQQTSANNTSVLRSIWLWGVLIGVVLVLGGAWITISRVLPSTEGGQPSGNPAPVAGSPAPDFALPTLDGETLRLSDYRGKTVLVNFWATWCGPCRAEFPEFEEASLENQEDLVIIGINNTVTDQRENIPGFVEEMGITFPIVLDEEGQVARQYNIFGMPTSIFVDPDGIVIEVFVGPINKAYIESKL